MSQAGLPVPPGFAVTTASYEHARDTAPDYDVLTDLLRVVEVGDTTGLAVAAAKAREMVGNWEIPACITCKLRSGRCTPSLRNCAASRTSQSGAILGHF
ncbi:MAG: PEP/pyruvate-binding domain-containing protein [Marmoricola sp.]